MGIIENTIYVQYGGAGSICSKEFYQWNRGVYLNISGVPSTSTVIVQYANEYMTETMNPEIQRVDGVIVSKIPDTLLMLPYAIKCYICVSEDDTSITVMDVCIPIVKRAKPSGYVYTPEELIGFNDLLSRLDISIAEVNELKSSIDESVTQANTAAQKANTAAETANAAASSANTEAQKAKTAANAANASAQTADASAVKIDDMTVTATTLETGSPATAALETVDEHYRLLLGLPKGDTGSPGIVISETEPDDPDVNAYIIPNGTVPPIDAQTLGGKNPEEYASTETVRQLRDDLQDKTRTNYLRPTLQIQTINGVTLTNDNGKIALNGTQTASFTIVVGTVLLKANKTYKMIGCKNGGWGTYSLRLFSSSDDLIIGDIGEGNVYTPNNDEVCTVKIHIASASTTFDNVVFKPMITTDLNATYDDFVSYDDSFVKGSDVIAKESIGDAWMASKTYAVGDYSISGNRLYKCKTAHTAGSVFDAAYWEAISVTSELSENAKQYSTNITVGTCIFKFAKIGNVAMVSCKEGDCNINNAQYLFNTPAGFKPIDSLDFIAGHPSGTRLIMNKDGLMPFNTQTGCELRFGITYLCE